MSKLFLGVKTLFFFFLAAFLLLGAVIVLGQLVGVFFGSGSVVVGLSEGLGPWAFAASTLCALCAFGLKYQPEHRRLRGPGDVDPEG
ncbi:hypothetical protein [Corynebacterium frankenforstense]|uniref:hypothetical protein n=1 Tax=Corynebacterium frankenforstense TaxID=1230998 RepID=UPI0026EB6DA3|nr:hypothetical protein [Corynebacterium frankenforstense]